MKYIPIYDCKEGYLYEIKARNASHGVFIKDEAGIPQFIISRNKFNSNFLFSELHYDIGAPFGTAKPLRELEESSIPAETWRSNKRQAQDKLNYLNSYEKN